MRNRSLICASTVLAAVLCRIGLSLESPVGSGTVPPTAYRSGLIPSINPIDASGNLIVTGNVAGGMHFRGIVPYSGITDFSAAPGTLSSTSGAFDSFLRRSAWAQSFERSGGGLAPYYSPTLTVTTQAQTGYYRQGYVSQASNRPLSMSQIEMERVIEQDVKRIPLGGEPVTEAQSLEQFWREMGIDVRRRPEPQDRGKEAEPYGLVTGVKTDVRTLLDLNPPSLSLRRTGMERDKRLATVEQETAERATMSQGLDVFEQMKKQLVEPATGLEGLTEGIEDIVKPVTGQAPRQAESNQPAVWVTSAGTSVPARAVASEVYKSFAAFREDKFNKHIRAAEDYMKQGRFYRAADAYTLATAYKPSDPLGYAGKSIALFATGEYMSSALFLARALEVFPEYAKFRIDLVSMIGDKDTVENSILDAREWCTRSDSGELEFLLSYIYYQMDRMEFAKMMIEEAANKMPDSTVVAAMKKAIEERAAKQ